VLELDMADDAALSFLDEVDRDPALRTVPVLAHHSHRLPRPRERALQARARTQPLELLPSLDELRERIALHLTAERPADVLPLVNPASGPEPVPDGTDSRLAGRTVLVVDDDARNVFALTGMLERHGIQVLHAENGRTGIEVLQRNPGVDLILMDVMMPELDGYGATSAIRGMPEFAQLPIIVVTAQAMHGDREKSLAAGASDHVTKPVDAQELLTCMQRWLGL
jgi:CheY-like chemotaxis protein